MKAILFDCDGTLADSFAIIAGTMRRAFAEAGLPVPAEAAIHGIIGLSLETAIAALSPGSPPREVGALTERYRETFRARRNEEAFEEPLFPGIDAMIRRLGGREDVALGMVTGKSRRGVDRILAAHGYEPVFRAVRTADDCPSKPHPAMVLECCAELGVEPRHALVVGDSIYDMQMAVAAGAPALGVAWGAASVQALTAAGASAVVEDVPALVAWIDRWLVDEPGGNRERMAS